MIIQSLWIGDSLSELERLSIKSFLKNGYEFHLYTYKEIKGIPKNCIILDANKILNKSEMFVYHNGPEKGSYSAFSNFFRYKLLLDIGGIWSDLDIINLNPLPNKEYIFGSESMGKRITEGWFTQELIQYSSCFIKCPKRSEFAKRCYNKTANIDKKNLVWGQIGPYLVEDTIKELSLDNYVLSPNKINPIPWYDIEELFDPNSNYGKLKDSYCIHLWNEQWRRQNINKNKDFPKGCIYEILKDMFQ